MDHWFLVLLAFIRWIGRAFIDLLIGVVALDPRRRRKRTCDEADAAPDQAGRQVFREVLLTARPFVVGASIAVIVGGSLLGVMFGPSGVVLGRHYPHADDLIQDVLIVVMSELPRFRHNQRTGAFRSWLRRILVNRLRNFWRGRGRDIGSGDSDLARRLNELEDPHGQFSRIRDDQHNRHLTRQLLDLIEPKFSASTRAAFRRLVLDGASPAEVPAELDLSLSAVFSAKSRVLRELRRLGRGLID